GRLSNLVFKFRTSSLLSGGAAGVTRYTTLIRPREGYSYEATVAYESSLFTIVILEIAPHGASSQKLPRRDISSCGTGSGRCEAIPATTSQSVPAGNLVNASKAPLPLCPEAPATDPAPHVQRARKRLMHRRNLGES